VLAAGCGETGRLSKGDYVARLRAIESSQAARDATRLFTNVVLEYPRLARPQCSSTLQTFERTLESIVDDVDDLRPPAEVQQLQDEFVAAARDSVAAVHDAGQDVAARRLTCGMPMNRRIYGLASTDQAEQVLMELGRKGYIIGSNSPD
jgi:hypothetical protein